MRYRNDRHHSGPLPALPTRRVMVPLVAATAVFTLLVGLNAPETPGFVPSGLGRDGLSLVLDDPTPAHSTALRNDFVPASGPHRQRVLRELSALGDDWREAGTRVTVTPMDLADGAVQFARQLDEWLGRNELIADMPFLNDDMGEAGHPVEAAGLVIHCRESERLEARELALALAPLLRGEVSIRFSERALPKQLDVFIEGAPRFNSSGVAYFPAADSDV